MRKNEACRPRCFRASRIVAAPSPNSSPVKTSARRLEFDVAANDGANFISLQVVGRRSRRRPTAQARARQTNRLRRTDASDHCHTFSSNSSDTVPSMIGSFVEKSANRSWYTPTSDWKRARSSSSNGAELQAVVDVFVHRSVDQRRRPAGGS